LLAEETIEIPVQVNGKLRDKDRGAGGSNCSRRKLEAARWLGKGQGTCHGRQSRQESDCGAKTAGQHCGLIFTWDFGN
jgi:hypothetical protein